MAVTDDMTESINQDLMVAENNAAIDPNQRPKCFKSQTQEFLFVLTAMMSLAMGTLLDGACSVIIVPMAIELNMSSAEITWVQAGATMTSGALLLFFAKIADTFGRRPLLVFSIGAFSVSCLGAGFAKSAIYMDVFCGLIGLWAAASIPPAIGILGAAYERPSKRKNKAFACFSAGNPIGFVAGSILSGSAAKIMNWRAAFYLLAIIYAVFFVVAICTAPETQDERVKISREALNKFDLLGTFLSIVGISLFCAALTVAGEAKKGWRTPYIIVLLILGVVFIAGFLIWENFSAFPLMPLRSWRDRNFSLINIVSLLGIMAFSSSNFWLSLYMQSVLEYSPLSAAIHLLPQCIAGILVNIASAFILHKVNNKLLTGVASLAYVAAALLLAIMKEESSYWAFIFPSLILGVIGADLQFNVANMYIMSSLSSEDQSLGGGIFNTVTRIWSTVGFGISTSIYNAESTSKSALQTESRPYTMVYWFCVASAAAGCFVVPFLSIGTQGNFTGTSVMPSNEGLNMQAFEKDKRTLAKHSDPTDTDC